MKRSTPYAVPTALLLAGLIAFFALFLWKETARNARELLTQEGEHLADSVARSTAFGIAAYQRQQDLLAGSLEDLGRYLDDRLSGDARRDREILFQTVHSRGLEAALLLDPRLGVVAGKPPGPGSGRRRGRGMMGRDQCPVPGAQPFWRELADFAASDRETAVLSRMGPGGCGDGDLVSVAVRRPSGGFLVLGARPDPKDGGEGLDRLFATLAVDPQIRFVSLVDADFTVLAHSDPAEVGKLQRTLPQGNSDTLVVTRLLNLAPDRPATLVVGLSTLNTKKILGRAGRNLALFALLAMALGVGGVLALFRLQERSRQKLEAIGREVEESKRLAAVGQMAAGVAHEVRNPLNAIGILVQRLHREVSPAEADKARFDEFSGLIRDEIGRLNRIVEDFLRLARKPVLNPGPVDLSGLLNELARVYGPEAEKAGVALTLGNPDQKAPAEADGEKLRQALQNVILNAIQATPAGGRVELSAEVSGGKARITVSDTGSGIAEGDLDRVFEPFYTQKPRGTGLGLSVVKSVVEAHGGRVTLENGPKGGTLCRITIPLKPGSSHAHSGR